MKSFVAPGSPVLSRLAKLVLEALSAGRSSASIVVALMTMAAVAHAQVQTVNLPASQITGSWGAAGCGTTVERGTGTANQTATMTWTDTTGASASTGIRIQIEAGWKFWCSGGGYSVSINNTAMGTGQVPSNSNNCLCNAAPYETTTQTFNAATFAWNPNGSNSINFTTTASIYIGIMDNSSGWSARITITVLNVPPNAPTNLHQAGEAGGTPRAVGYVSNATIYFQATVTDADTSNLVGVQAEVLPAATPFATGITGTVVQTAVANLVPQGSQAEALLDFSTTTLPSGAYHWRLRSMDASGTFSAWVVFDAAAVHFTTDFAPPTQPGGPFSPSNIQLVNLEPTASVEFSWGSATDPGGPAAPIAYRLEVSAFSNFNVAVYDSVVTTQSVNVNMTAAQNPYFWRVYAVDAAGNQSTPTDPLIFQLSWTVITHEHDRPANCGVSTGSGSPLALALAVLVALAGFASMRRR